MPATKKAPTKKTASKKSSSKKAVKGQIIRSLEIAPDEKHAFMLISKDFDGKKHKCLQVVSTILLLGILATMVYLSVLANEIANAVLIYG